VFRWRSTLMHVLHVMPTESAIDESRLRQTVARLMELLARRDYTGFCGSARRSRVTPQEVDAAIRGYGRTIITPPAEASRAFDVIAVTDSIPARWSVVVPLWTKQEGRSDLSLEITVEDVDGLHYAVQIEDLHVL
jgi:hypothetical protein